MGRKWGDRKDGTLMRDISSMHYIMPLMYPNRCDNEAFMHIRIDLTNADRYLEKKNAENPAYKYNLFQLVVAAMLKTIKLRPRMNCFIANQNMYQRNELTAAFTVKKIFSDKGEEALARIYAKDTDTIDTIHGRHTEHHVYRYEDGHEIPGKHDLLDPGQSRGAKYPTRIRTRRYGRDPDHLSAILPQSGRVGFGILSDQPTERQRKLFRRARK